jgi:hypothetical protein
MNGHFHNEHRMDTSPEVFGEMRDSADLLPDRDALHARIAEEGYLYLPGILDVDRVNAARRSVLEILKGEGALDPGSPLTEGVLNSDANFSFRPDLAFRNPRVKALLYEAEMMDFFRFFFGGDVRHFDYTWLRAKVAGNQDAATPPHCDVVYMGRGTSNLFTAWTPLGDVPYEMGGLMVLEGSNRRRNTLRDYWKMDVDTYCTNGPEAEDLEQGRQVWESSKNHGTFECSPIQARETIGGRWLTTEYAAGDLLVFTVFTLHASLNNNTNRVRLSTDSRYQPASEAVDERWIGENPPAHGPESKIGMIC